MSQMVTRSQPIPEDPFPPIERFQQKAKLPKAKDIIGVIRHVAMQKDASNKVSFEVAKMVYSKWYHDSIFCHSLSTIKRRVEGVWKVYSDYKRQ